MSDVEPVAGTLEKFKGRVVKEFRPPVNHLITIDKENIISFKSKREMYERAEALRDLRIKKAREDPNAFMEYCFCDMWTGEPQKQQWFHDIWQESMSKNKRLLIIAPRNHGKTTQIVGRVIWEIGTNPNLRVKIACASDGAAKDRLFEVKQHIEYNKRIHEVFPELVPSPGAEWSKHKIIVKRTARHKDATVEALGITATATGGRCDLLIADDVVDRRNALSFPALREQIKQAWKSDWTNLLEPTSRVWYICTLWHKDDLSHELMDNPAYRVLFYQISETFESMWPEKWPSEILELRHREIGSVEFNRGFRNVAVDLDSATVHPDWIKFRNLNKDPLFNLRLKNGELIFITSYDTAGTPSGGKQQDYASSVVLAASPMDQKVYVVSAAHYRATVKKQAERVVREQKKYNAYKAIVEKASQAAVDEWVLELEPAMMGIMEVQKPTGENKRSRLMGVTPLMERGQVIFSHNLNPHDRDNNYNPGTGCIYDELIDFPYAKHDDMVDAFSQGLHAVRRLFLDRGSNLDATIDMSIDDMHDSEYLI